MADELCSLEPEGTIWCVGLVERQRRPLLTEERAILSTRLELARRRQRGWRLTVRGALALAIAAFPVWLTTTDLQPKHWVGFPLFYLLLVCSAGAALVAALAEVIVGFSLVSRAFFATMLLLSPAVAFNEEQPELAMITTFAGSALYIAGMFVAIVRTLSFRRTSKVIPLLERDLVAGTASEFSGAPIATELPVALKPLKSLLAASHELSFAALTRSGVVVSLADQAVDSYDAPRAQWHPLELMSTATGGGLEVPLPGGPTDGTVAHRHATTGELAELVRHRERLLRRAAVIFAGGTYAAAFVMRAIENLLAQKLDSRLSGTGWLIAVSLAAVFTVPQLLTWARLTRALRTKRILVLRDPMAPTTDGAPAAEMWLGTRIVWTVEGQPAAWRHTRF